uniref:hypothetical protein n=1 Tax=Streptomyces anthocyanicus TaxID=68174 RepID=UPI002F910EA7
MRRAIEEQNLLPRLADRAHERGQVVTDDQPFEPLSVVAQLEASLAFLDRRRAAQPASSSPAQKFWGTLPGRSADSVRPTR